jgi:xanthine phosphoribosyltransferase
MESGMQALKDRIRKEGRNLGGGILKVDSFINHQVDPLLMDACGAELANRFRDLNPAHILTAEISGIAPALMTAMHLGIPVIYARKVKPVTMPDQVFLTLAPSHTKGRMVELILSPENITRGEKLVIIDDFLASGMTILGLARLAEAAGAEVVGIGALIEKSFENGRENLSGMNIPIESLVCVTNMEDGAIEIAD